MELLRVACDNPANKIRIWMHELAGLANGEFNETAKPTDKPLITVYTICIICIDESYKPLIKVFAICIICIDESYKPLIKVFTICNITSFYKVLLCQ